MADQHRRPDPREPDQLAGQGRLTVTPHWRDRAQYGVVMPVLTVGGAALLAAIAPTPPSAPAAAAFYGALLGAAVAGASFALTAWRSRLTIGPSGVAVRAALRERLVPWNQLERIEVGRPHHHAGRRGRGPRWRALRVRVQDESLPLVAAASNRPRPTMHALVTEVDQALAVYGHRVDQPNDGERTDGG